jgi:pimeloyl-ACP methyl ester carboxylesterase
MSDPGDKTSNNPVARLLIMVVLVYLGFGLLLYVNQRGFIYFPTPPVTLEGITALTIQNNGESIRVDVVNAGQSRALIYFGGNAEAVAYNAPALRQVFGNYTIYLMNYRGYGGSTGEPAEESLYSDALALFDQVSATHESVSVIGRSLGSGVASYLASQKAVHQLVLVTPFDSIESVAASQYPVYPISIMLWDKYDSISRVPAIQAKTLILIAINDYIVPASHGRKLASAFPEQQVTTVELSNAGHNTVSDNPRYYLLMRQFLD